MSRQVNEKTRVILNMRYEHRKQRNKTEGSLRSLFLYQQFGIQKSFLEKKLAKKTKRNVDKEASIEDAHKKICESWKEIEQKKKKKKKIKKKKKKGLEKGWEQREERGRENEEIRFRKRPRHPEPEFHELL